MGHQNNSLFLFFLLPVINKFQTSALVTASRTGLYCVQANDWRASIFNIIKSTSRRASDSESSLLSEVWSCCSMSSQISTDYSQARGLEEQLHGWRDGNLSTSPEQWRHWYDSTVQHSSTTRGSLNLDTRNFFQNTMAGKQFAHLTVFLFSEGDI